MVDQQPHRRVVSPLPCPPFTGPAYEYILASDHVPALGAQDGVGDQAIAHVKLFIPGSRWTLFICEHDRSDQIVFGWVVSPLGADCDEWGYASLHEIAALRVPLGLPPERDLDFAPGPLAEAREEHTRRTGETAR
jgi:hypothetical protein